MHVKGITYARSRNHFCREKVISITYSECVLVALVIQHVERIVVSSVAYLTLQYFSKLPRKARFSEKKVIEHKMCFDFLYNVCLNHFSI
jgi:hypothetical protein